MEEVPGIGSITGERASSHPSAACVTVMPRCFASALSAAICGFSSPAACCRWARGAQGMNAMPCLRAVLDHVLGAAVRDVVAVLHRDHLDDFRCALQLAHLEVRYPDVPDLAFLLQLHQLAERILERHRRIDRVQLVQVDALELELAQARLACRAQMLRTPVVGPLGLRRPFEAALRGDDQPLRVRMQSLGDQDLAHVGSVSIRRVDEVHAERDRTLQQALRRRRIARIAPDPGTRDAHGAIAHAVHAQVAADRDLAGARCGRCARGRRRGGRDLGQERPRGAGRAQ